MKKGHSKFMPLVHSNVPQGEVLLPGRQACNCEASKHALVNNCLHCGRIVCEQERSGPCFTCGNLVCTPREQEQIAKMSKASCKLYAKLMSQGKENADQTGNVKAPNIQSSADSSLQNALKHRDKLLEFDQTIERRTKVIDDQNDYFQTNSSWLSNKESAVLKKKKEEVYNIMHGRQKTLITLDFNEKKVIEETKPVINYEVELLRPDISIFECSDPVDINIPVDFIPTYQDGNTKSKNKYNVQMECDTSESEDRLKHIRIQDRELQEMSDDGKCLSLHQPYASFFVAGIKKHEGRVWYTSYRGRLWIHAAAKQPPSREINDLQNFYRNKYGICTFPENYPPGCLLGCVDLVGCLPQDEYKSQYPDGEIASPYVFICENPQELKLKFPMQGKHKIFKLDSNVHQAAKKTLKKIT